MSGEEQDETMIPFTIDKIEYFLNLINQDYIVYYSGHFYWKYQMVANQYKKIWKDIDCPRMIGYVNDELYIEVYFRFNNTGKRHSISEHQIIYAYFHGIDTMIYGLENQLEINHIDTIKWNNDIDNLELITKQANIKHASENGLSIIGRIGEDHPGAKLTERKVLAIRHLLKYGSSTQREIADMFNVDYSTISSINTKQSWRNI